MKILLNLAGITALIASVIFYIRGEVEQSTHDLLYAFILKYLADKP